MAIEKRDVRQWPMSDFIRITYDELAAGAQALADLQGGEMIVAGSVTVETAWNPTGGTPAATLDIGDGDDPNRYTSSSIDLTATGRTELTLTGHVYSVASELQATFSETDADTSTAGEAVIEFTVIREGRQNETA